jgi:hypothetical protein
MVQKSRLERLMHYEDEKILQFDKEPSRAVGTSVYPLGFVLLEITASRAFALIITASRGFALMVLAVRGDRSITQPKNSSIRSFLAISRTLEPHHRKL